MSNGTATNGAETNDTHTNGTTTTESFSFNVAFTDSVNTGYAPGDEAHLTPEELWIGIKHGARHPYDFSSYIANCEILSGTKNEFVRRLTVGDGAVHSKSGMVLDQDVVLYPMLSVCLFPQSPKARPKLTIPDRSDDHWSRSKDDHPHDP